MKIFAKMSATVFIAGAFGTGLYADGSKCVSLDNDIARLACFDEAYRDAKAPNLTPDEAFIALAELVNFESSKERLVLTGSEDRCDLRVLYEGFLFRHGRSLPYQMNSYINLSNVEGLGDWRGIRHWDRGLRGITAFTDRTAEGVWQARIAKTYIDIFTKDDFNFYAIPNSDFYEGRDAAVYLLVEDYQPDAEKVEKALWDAVLACGGGS